MPRIHILQPPTICVTATIYVGLVFVLPLLGQSIEQTSWLTDLNEARQIARETDRPLMMVFR